MSGSKAEWLSEWIDHELSGQKPPAGPTGLTGDRELADLMQTIRKLRGDLQVELPSAGYEADGLVRIRAEAAKAAKGQAGDAEAGAPIGEENTGNTEMGFESRGLARIRAAAVAAEAVSARKAARNRQRRVWVTAAASLLLVASICVSQLWTQKGAEAAEITVAASQKVADIGPSEVLFPKYANTIGEVGYGIGDDIHMLDRNTSVSKDFNSGLPYERDAAWSPDGKRSAFVGYDAASGQTSPGLWVAEADGRNARQILKPADPDTAIGQPAWSPDGSQIAYSSTVSKLSDETGVTYETHIEIINADGTGHSVLTTGSQPAWSPDGKSIAITDGAGDLKAIWIYGLQSKEKRKLADGQGASWSPKGPFIVYSKLRLEQRRLPEIKGSSPSAVIDIRYDELWAVNTESGTETRLTESAYPKALVDRMLAEAAAKGEAELNAAVSGETSDEDPSWSHDGSRILFTRSSVSENGPHYQLQELTVTYK